jgi:hypothetical protein
VGVIDVPLELLVARLGQNGLLVGLGNRLNKYTSDGVCPILMIPSKLSPAFQAADYRLPDLLPVARFAWPAATACGPA